MKGKFKKFVVILFFMCISLFLLPNGNAQEFHFKGGDSLVMELGNDFEFITFMRNYTGGANTSDLNLQAKVFSMKSEGETFMDIRSLIDSTGAWKAIQIGMTIDGKAINMDGLVAYANEHLDMFAVLDRDDEGLEGDNEIEADEANNLGLIVSYLVSVLKGADGQLSQAASMAIDTFLGSHNATINTEYYFAEDGTRLFIGREVRDENGNEILLTDYDGDGTIEIFGDLNADGEIKNIDINGDGDFLDEGDVLETEEFTDPAQGIVRGKAMQVTMIDNGRLSNIYIGVVGAGGVRSVREITFLDTDNNGTNDEAIGDLATLGVNEGDWTGGLLATALSEIGKVTFDARGNITAVYSRAVKKDRDGNPILDKNGNTTYVYTKAIEVIYDAANKVIGTKVYAEGRQVGTVDINITAAGDLSSSVSKDMKGNIVQEVTTNANELDDAYAAHWRARRIERTTKTYTNRTASDGTKVPVVETVKSLQFFVNGDFVGSADVEKSCAVVGGGECPALPTPVAPVAP